jgi:phage shock protein PspC (stress-responsive transcriptional regulator)
MANNRKLYRSITDHKLAGVCGGIAEYFNIDSTIIRLAWVLFTIFPGGILGGVLLYFIAYLIIPTDPGYTDI